MAEIPATDESRAGAAAAAPVSGPLPAGTDAMHKPPHLVAIIGQVYRGQGVAWGAALPLLLMVAGLAEGVGITMLLPLFIALNEDASKRSTASRAVLDAMTTLGIPVTMGMLLVLLILV